MKFTNILHHTRESSVRYNGAGGAKNRPVLQTKRTHFLLIDARTRGLMVLQD